MGVVDVVGAGLRKKSVTDPEGRIRKRGKRMRRNISGVRGGVGTARGGVGIAVGSRTVQSSGVEQDVAHTHT